MRVAGVRRIGAPVQLFDVPDPRALADDETLIEVKAAGVGNWDDFVRTGGWDVGRGPPMALGVEAAGVVVAIGRAVERWTAGDEVLIKDRLSCCLHPDGSGETRLTAMAAHQAAVDTGVPAPTSPRGFCGCETARRNAAVGK